MALSEFARQLGRMLDEAPCPVSVTLLMHRAEVDDRIETAATLVAVRAALSELVAAKKALHVPHHELARRWPPVVFERCKQSDLDDRVMLAIGAWASTKNVEHFDEAVRDAHLPKEHKQKWRPYVDLGWWGALEPSPEFVAQAEVSMKGEAGLYGL